MFPSIGTMIQSPTLPSKMVLGRKSKHPYLKPNSKPSESINMNPTEIVETLINGNLTSAQARAKFFSAERLIQASEDLGYSYNQAVLIACYLKKVMSFQAYCDHMNKTA